MQHRGQGRGVQAARASYLVGPPGVLRGLASACWGRRGFPGPADRLVGRLGGTVLERAFCHVLPAPQPWRWRQLLRAWRDVVDIVSGK